MIVITGRTCSGKDTLGKLLEKEYGFSKVISCTTRPPRPGEENFKDYIFLSNDEYDDMLGEGLFAETTEYKQENGDIWRYATRKYDYRKEKDNRKLYVILNPAGVIQLINQGIHVDILHIKDNCERRLRERYVARELGDAAGMHEFEFGNKKEELNKKFDVRFKQDNKDFGPYEKGLADKAAKYTEINSINYIHAIHNIKSIKSVLTKKLRALKYLEVPKTIEELEEENRIFREKYEEMRKLNENLLNEKSKPIKTEIPRVEEWQITFGSLRHIIPRESTVEFYDKDDGSFIFSMTPHFYELLEREDSFFYDKIRIYAIKFRYEKENEAYPCVLLQIDINDLRRR